MSDICLKVNMLGGFTLSLAGGEPVDLGGRSRKPVLFLAYLLHNRRNGVSRREMLEVLWGGGESDNTDGALKMVLHRVRTALNQLYPNAGKELIVSRGGRFSWNAAVCVELDCERFEQLCREGAEAGQTALELYSGEFLNALSGEPWVLTLAAYYHNLYVETALKVLPHLLEKGRLAECDALSERALRMETSREELYCHRMRCLIELGRQREVVSLYEEMSALFLTEFGVIPGEESRVLYREATRTATDHIVLPGFLRDQLREEGEIAGALFCDYDFFKILYQAEARSVARRGDAVHICLMSLVDESGGQLPQRSLERAADNFRAMIQSNLRKGDIVSRCSASQFVIMLPMANYENSCMVCDRVVKAFARRYPHSPARIRCTVQPLEPVT